MDRTKEAGALAEPLYLDVAATVLQNEQAAHSSHSTDRMVVVGGRYGLSSKEFTPAMAIAVFDNLAAAVSRNKFTVGIQDDVLGRSLSYAEDVNCVPAGTQQCVFWGMGSDGTVGANKEAIKIIADNTDLYTQSGGVTVSHLRFGPSPIGSSYLVEKADYMAINQMSYMQKFDTISKLAPGGVLVLNTPFTTVENVLPTKVKRDLARAHPELYVLDALAVAISVGLGKRVNMVMQTVFFQLAGVLPMDRAIPLLKQSIEKAYAKKGPKKKKKVCVCRRMEQAIPLLKKSIEKAYAKKAPKESIAKAYAKKGPKSTTVPKKSIEKAYAKKGPKIDVPDSWASLETEVLPPEPDSKKSASSKWQFIEDVAKPMLALEGDRLPVSVFEPAGFTPRGTTVVERRAIAATVPVWKAEACTQCNICSYVCPHAAIRPFLATDADMAGAPESFNTLQARGAGLGGFKYRMQFSGACEGCGETPYVKLLTQLFGERLIIANATGFSSIWGGSAPSSPYTTNADGFGPAWANSLFEDNAQFGLGIAMGTVQRRRSLHRHVEEALALEDAVPMSAALRAKLTDWALVWQQTHECNAMAKDLMAIVRAEKAAHPVLDHLAHESDMFLKPSIWIVGGDGWAYDIGFGGLDHVMSTGEDVNIMILDTEMYSNTGGQKSKSTPLGAVANFASGGKLRPKKDLGAMAMSYGDVYVASTCLQSNFGQAVKAMAEAERYQGTSLMINYPPCVMHGIEGGMCNLLDDAKEATDTGYWPLYRFDPSVVDDGKKHPFQLDSKKVKGDLEHLLHHENRFAILERKDAATAERLHHDLPDMNVERLDRLKHMAAGEGASPSHGVTAVEELQKKMNLPVGSNVESLDEHHTPIVGVVVERPVGPGGAEPSGKKGFAKPSHFSMGVLAFCGVAMSVPYFLVEHHTPIKPSHFS
eukprot:gene5518-4149_t